jgi:hypothetical protein
MGLVRTDQGLWTVTNWLSRNEPHGHEFSVWVSPLFLRTAANTEYDQKKIQGLARGILRGAGKIVANHHRCLSFGKWGLEVIDLLENGRCFHLEQKSDDILLSAGGKWSCHNIDHAQEQSILMAIWCLWARYISDEVSSIAERAS